MKLSVTIELLDALKSALGGVSDYRAAQLLAVKQQTMSQYRTGRSPLSPEKVLIACELAGLDAVDWLLRLYRERAKCDRERNALDLLRTRATTGK